MEFLFILALIGSRLIISVLTHSSFGFIHFNKTIEKQIVCFLTENTNVDQLHEDNQKYSRASLDDFELGRLLGYGCNAAVYEARLRTPIQEISHLRIPSEFVINDENSSESDSEIVSRQSSNTSSVSDDTYDNLDDEERLHELTLKEGMIKVS